MIFHTRLQLKETFIFGCSSAVSQSVSLRSKPFRASWSRNLRTRDLASTLPQSVMFLGDRKRLLSCKLGNRPQVNQFDFSAEVSAKTFTYFSSYNKSSFHCMLHCLDFSMLTDITCVHRSVELNIEFKKRL